MRSLFPVLALTIVSGCHTSSRAPLARHRNAGSGPPPSIQRVSPIAREGSAIALARVGARRLAFVADEDESAIHTLDLDMRNEIARTDIVGRPVRVLVLPDGRLVASLRDAASIVVFAIDQPTTPLRRVVTIATADEPIALALGAADDKLLWVASGWGRTLQGLDLEKGTVRTSIPLGREPRALLLSEDGSYAFVGYMSEGAITVVNLGTERTGVIELAQQKRRFGRQTFALSRMRVDGTERIFAPYVMVEPGAPHEKVKGYGASGFSSNVFDVAMIDPANARVLVAPPEDEETPRCPLPRAVAADPTSETVFIACLGDDTLVRLDGVPWITAKSSLSGGPTALAIDEVRRELIVFAQFERKVSVIPIPAALDQPLIADLPRIALSHVAGRGLSVEASIGRRVFHDALDVRISFGGRPCATCHPEGRDDGLVWPSPNGPRQTIFLAGRLGRGAPFGWDAKHKDLAEHVKSTTKNLRGQGLDETSTRYLTTWLAAMPGPARTLRELTEQEEHGRELFNSKLTGCSGCHNGGGSDGQPYDVGSKTSGDVSKLFLTPSLRYVSGTAPYFHDGRYSSLFSLVQGCDGKMGSTRQLTVADMRALEAYLRTL